MVRNPGERLKSVKIDFVGENTKNSQFMSRRELLKLASGAWLAAPIVQQGTQPLTAPSNGQQVIGAAPYAPIALSPEDDLFLEELERATFNYFWEQGNPQTGLVKDRCHVRSRTKAWWRVSRPLASDLTALCIGEKRQFIHYYEARRRA